VLKPPDRIDCAGAPGCGAGDGAAARARACGTRAGAARCAAREPPPRRPRPPQRWRGSRCAPTAPAAEPGRPRHPPAATGRPVQGRVARRRGRRRRTGPRRGPPVARPLREARGSLHAPRAGAGPRRLRSARAARPRPAPAPGRPRMPAPPAEHGRQAGAASPRKSAHWRGRRVLSRQQGCAGRGVPSGAAPALRRARARPPRGLESGGPPHPTPSSQAASCACVRACARARGVCALCRPGQASKK
jgi:hypothetical protein